MLPKAVKFAGESNQNQGEFKMNIRSIGLLAVCTLVLAACGSQPAANSATANSTNASSNASSKPAVDRAAAEAALKEADLAWAAAAAKRDVDATVAFMTDDGVTLSPNVPAAQGKDAIRKEWQGLLGLKDGTISWAPATVQVAESGEIGYTTGTWKLTWTDEKLGKVEDHGKYLEVWKNVDGKWKCQWDMYSSDQAAPAGRKDD